MTGSGRPVITCFTVLLLAVGLTGAAQEPAKVPAADELVTLSSGGSLGGWFVEKPKSPPDVNGQVLSLKDQSGWLRTERAPVGAFVLRFDARAAEPNTRAVVAILGNLETPADPAGAAYVMPLLDTTSAHMRRLHLPYTMVVSPEPSRIKGALRSAGDWQSYEITRLEGLILARLNGSVIVRMVGPVSLDGWIGLRAISGRLDIRSISIATAPASPVPLFYRPGPDSGLTLPKLLREVKPSYSREAMRQTIQGTVLIEGIVDVDGQFKAPVIRRSLDRRFGLDLEALSAALRWRFAPGTHDGTAVPTLITIEMAFKLK